MIPETHANNTIDLYEFEQFPYKLKKVRTIINNVNAVDSVLLQKDKLWYLFTNVYSSENYSHNDNLSIFISNDLLNDEFKQQHINPVVKKPIYARMGGQFLHKKIMNYIEYRKIAQYDMDIKLIL